MNEEIPQNANNGCESQKKSTGKIKWQKFLIEALVYVFAEIILTLSTDNELTTEVKKAVAAIPRSKAYRRHFPNLNKN